MSENVEYEINEDWKTGSLCTETANYLCKMHPYVEEFVREGERFPKCDQKGLPHNTQWHKIL
ncbi:hypothetical protein ML462_15670 [Gramella lutea]|uniref:Uncharacterized protein n=1 Tax=Christiangramia lutea TaxID=1607951 RepID=A0A9X1V4T6_9FLAO|nr:hypothetical protein [Christiangramia lutea]MCH4824612.1 hypothetical protein [Christiangramia lutea]